MNADELRAFLRGRKPGYSVRNDNVEDLACYGCAHGASTAPAPGRPSGERPCVTCIRNHEDWRVVAPPDPDSLDIVIDDHGNARCFDAAAGFSYNGSPYPNWPPDNYVTMDAHDREDFYRRHPDYEKPISFRAGTPIIVT